MNLSILLTGKAFLPEAYAYKQYLMARGWDVKLCPPGKPEYQADLVISFQPERLPDLSSYRCRVIHEYHSLPTGSFPRIRQFIKKSLTRRPNGRIFLSPIVRSELRFQDDVPFINRDMGVDDAFFHDNVVSKEFDIVYCGSIEGRTGIIECIDDLAKMGLRILIVGQPTVEFMAKFDTISNICMIGPLPRERVPLVIRRARYGLNFTPDIYPLNIQTSTKTLEYLAAGLGVISSRYKWAEDFFVDGNKPVIWLDTLFDRNINLPDQLDKVDMSAYRWSRILEGADFEAFLRSLV